jgi:thiol-disulfide isomerase/thioredoxin
MNIPGFRLLAAALIMLLGLWAGLRFYSAHAPHAPHARHATRGPDAGRASPAAKTSSEPAVADADASMPDGAMLRPVVPAQLPEVSLNDLIGKPVAISTWHGRSLVINFWATWCAPCRREIPLLQSLATDWADRGLTVIGVAVDYPDKVRQFADEFKIAYPLLIGEQDALDVAAKFGMDSPGFPFTVFTDRRGEVVALFVGELHRPQAEFILNEVQNLNQARVALPEARRVIAEGLGAMADQNAH